MTPDHAAQTPDRISIRDDNNTLTITLDGQQGRGALTFVLGIVFLVFGGALWPVVAYEWTLGLTELFILASPFALGGLAAYAGLCMVLNKTHFIVGDKTILVTVGPIPQRAAREFDATDIAQLYVAPYTVYRRYRGMVDVCLLKLDTLDYRELELVPENEDGPQMEWIAAAIQRRLGIAERY